MLKHRARQLNQAHVYPIGALTVGLKGEQLTEMSQLLESGCVAFSQADVPILDTQVLSRALAYAATFGFPVWLRAQDPHLSKGGVAHDGEVATRLGLPAIPVTAETIALNTILTLAERHGTRVHLCRLSSAEGVALVKHAKARGVAVTCDVAVHHLHLSEVDVGYFDSNCHVVPPLRSLRDRDALRAGVQDGTIDAICSDHTPVDDDAKQVPFAEAEPGASALELLLPLTLKWAAEARIALPQALARITCDAARVLGVDAGHLAPGHNADVCIFDPHASWKIEARSLKSQGKNTPFIGYELQGRVCVSMINGHSVFELR
jgi:dihydroorotase